MAATHEFVASSLRIYRPDSVLTRGNIIKDKVVDCVRQRRKFRCLGAHCEHATKRPCIENDAESTLELVERLSGHVSAWLIGRRDAPAPLDQPTNAKSIIGPLSSARTVLTRRGSCRYRTDARCFPHFPVFCSADKTPESQLGPKNPKGLAEELPWCTDGVK
jgi:hypothetical protein